MGRVNGTKPPDVPTIIPREEALAIDSPSHGPMTKTKIRGRKSKRDVAPVQISAGGNNPRVEIWGVNDSPR
jgi:hypothetical protein